MAINKYDKMHKDLMDYILSGEMHSTLIGMQIAVDSSSRENDIRNIELFVEYVTGLVSRSENFAKSRKDNVKLGANKK